MTVELPPVMGESVAETHFWLTQAMAKAVGTNLTEAIAKGLLTREDFAGMVVRCGSCEFSEKCVRWMAETSDETHDAPAYCLNHEAIEALQAKLARGY